MSKLRSAINPVLEPVAGEIGIDPRIVGNGWEIHEEEQPQKQSSQKDSKKETRMSAHQAEHRGNIALSRQLLALSH